jgi:SAM-dependent methyltransferase
MNPNVRLTQVFFDIQRGLPRQGPGDDASTLRALSLCAELPERPDVLDVGCGPGRQTIALAQALDGRITAGDLHQEYLDQLVATAVAEGLRERIGQMRVDMLDLPFGRDSFDLIWSEGAAYILGFGEAFARWQYPLRARGYIAVTELTWLTDRRPAPAADFFASEYPPMTDVATNLATIEEQGCEMIGHFTLPDAAWWDHYYTPLEAKLPELRVKYADDAEALELVEMTAREIDVRRRFGDSYGYEFYVARAPDRDSLGPAAVERDAVEARGADAASTRATPERDPAPPSYPPPLD